MANVGVLSLSFKLTGNDALDAAFQELDKRIQKKILREALRPAAKLLQAAWKTQIHSRSGTAEQSLKVRAGKRSRKNPDAVTISVVTEGGFFRGKAFYLGFVELGWRTGSRKLGDARKKNEARHWGKKALSSVETEAMALSQRLIAEGIERETAAINGGG